MENAYPFFSHDGFSEVKAHTPEQLRPVLADASAHRAVFLVDRLRLGQGQFAGKLNPARGRVMVINIGSPSIHAQGHHNPHIGKEHEKQSNKT